MANLQSNIEYLSNKMKDTFENRPGFYFQVYYLILIRIFIIR